MFAMSLSFTRTELQRYSRHILLQEVGAIGQAKLRAARVLVVGAGGLGQLLSFHMGLFHMNKTATILAAMLFMVACVDALSFAARRWLTR